MSHYASLEQGRSVDSETSPPPFATGSSSSSAGPARQHQPLFGRSLSFAPSPPRIFVDSPAAHPPQSSGECGPGSATAASAYPDAYSPAARGQQQRHYDPSASFASSRSVEHVLQRFPPSSSYESSYSLTAPEYSYYSPGLTSSAPVPIQPTNRHFAPRESYPSFSASYPPPSQPAGFFASQFFQQQHQSRQKASKQQRTTIYDPSAYQSSLAPMLEHRAQSTSSSPPPFIASNYAHSKSQPFSNTSELATSLAGSQLGQHRSSPSFSDRGPPSRFQSSSPLSQHAEESEDTPAPWSGSPTSLHSPTSPTALASFHPASSSNHHRSTPHAPAHPADPMPPQSPGQPAHASTASLYHAPEHHRRSLSDPYPPSATPSSASSDGDGDAYDPAHEVDSDAYSPGHHTKSRRASGAGPGGGGRSSSSRPISPITGLPTKVLAKRLFPPRDAAKRRFYCPHAGCGKAFGRPSARETHLRSHNGIKPFACPIPACGRPFSVFSNLKRHMIVHPGVDFRGIVVHDLPHLEYDESATPPLYFRREDAVSSSSNHPRDSGPPSWNEQPGVARAHWGDAHERASGARWTGPAEDEDQDMESGCGEGMGEDESEIG